MSEPTKDPRTDRSPDGPKYPTPPGQPHEAPGGVGNEPAPSSTPKTPPPPSTPKP